MRRRLLMLSVSALVACGELQHESPYDPETPGDRQARTVLSGAVSLESVGGLTPTLAGIPVSLAGQSHAATTDATGRYRIEGVPPGTYTVQAVLSGYEIASITGVTATLDTGGTTVEVPTLSLRRVRASLAGRVELRLPNDVLEATGGASVSIEPAATGLAADGPLRRLARLPGGGGATALSVGATVTDGTGAFVIPDVPAPLGSYTLTASKVGYVTQTSTVTFLDGAFVVQTVQLAIDPGAVVGSVAVAGASSAFGVTVRARGATLGGTPWEDVTTTDALGAFRLSGLPAGTYVVSYERGDLLTVSAGAQTVAPGHDTNLAAVALSPATGGVRGVVALGGAASSAGVVVTATGSAGTGSTVTDASGAFTLAGLPVGTYSVTARKDPEWQSETRTGVVVVRDATTTIPSSPVALQPIATASLAGRALLEGATVHSGTTATLTGADFRGVAVPAGTTATTAADGSWSFTSLRAGSYQVAFTRGGFDEAAPVGASILTAQTAALGTLTLAASRGSVGGTVLASGASSHAGTVIEIAGGPDTGTAVSDAAGAWRVDGLRVGTSYTVTYRRAGYASPAPSAFGVASGVTTPVGLVTLQVATTASITGVAAVVRPTAPAASADVLVSLTGTDLNGAAVTGSTQTVAGGAYTLTGLPQGTYALTFSKANYATETRSGVAVTAGGTAVAPAVALGVATGTIAGQILLSAGSAAGFVQGTDYSGTIVSLTGLEDGLSVPVAVTDAAGNFRFEGVPVHTSHLAYGVTAQRPSYATANGTVTADPMATVAAVPNPMTLLVAVGSVAGLVAIDDSGTQTAPPSGAVTLTLSGAAFNSTAFGASAGNTGGAFFLPSVPPGTYDLVATSGGRTCAGGRAITVGAGQALSLTTPFVCTDSVAPGSVALGSPQGAGADPGFTSSTGVSIPILAHATDLSGNLLGYQYAVGPVPSWDTAPVTSTLVPTIPLPVGTLTDDGTWTLWARAVDRVRNAGPAASVEVVRDGGAPAPVEIHTARTVVDATSTTAILTGGQDPNFRSYQSCTAFVAATAACLSPCTPADSAASVAVSFDAANRKACLWARAVDRAGNASPAALVEVVSDLAAPTGPAISPLYDPAIVTVHADYVDFQITTPAVDAPGPGGAWRDIAWVEADTGGGFAPICPGTACRAGGVYSPCSCGCTDPRLVCNAGAFWAIRLPLNSGTANRIAVRAVDLAGNVGSGASQEVLTSGVMSPVATTVGQESAPRVRGKTLLYSSGGATIVDLGANLRFDDTDPTCAVAADGHEYSAALLDSETLVYSTGTELRVRRPGATWCAGHTETPVAGRSGPEWTIHVVSASLDPATGRLERVVWAENRMSGGAATRVWALDGGSTGHVDDGDAPAPELIASTAGSYTTRLELGGDALLVRSSPSSWAQSYGGFQVLHRPAGGWASGAPVVFPIDAYLIRAASLDASGTQLAWLTLSPSHTIQQVTVATPGPDGVFHSGDELDPDAIRTFATPSGFYTDVAIEGGHLVVTEFLAAPTAYVTHWAAGADGRFGTLDDTFARVMPSSAYRQLPALGDGLAGGLMFFTQGASNNNDVLAADLSAFRWDALSDKTGSVYPRSNHEGTYFFGRSGGVWAKAPDGQETTRDVDAAFYAADGRLFAAQAGPDVVVHEADASGRFFTTAAPAGWTFLPGRAGNGSYGGSIAIAVGDGRVVVGTCETRDAGGSCTQHSVTLLEPDPLPSTARAIRLDRPADGAPPNSSLGSATDSVGASAGHLVYQCRDTVLGIGDAICVREPGPNGRYEVPSDPGYDDVACLLRAPGTGSPYSGTSSVKLDRHRVAFFMSGGGTVVSVDAGSDGSLCGWADGTASVLGATTTVQSQFLAIAGNYVAWMTSGATGPQPWVGDVRSGTSKELATHYSPKYGITVDRTGRVLWDDQIFTTRAVFLFAP